jgi:CBS domain-containing protein
MSLTVGEVMTRKVYTLHPDMTVTEMDRVLLAHQVGGAPVVAEGRLVGVASLGDVISALYEEQRKAQRVSDFYTSPFPISIPALERLARDSREIADRMIKLRVRDVMTPAPRTAQPSDPIEVVARLMISGGFHRVPVVESERLVGIVSSLDLVRLIADGALLPA